MIEYVKGNFFDYDANIRVNTVNCVGVMGAGAALQFKEKYPDMFKEYLKECKIGNVKIGNPHVWHSNPLFSKRVTVVNFPTKTDWKKPSEYEYVEKGLEWFRNYLSQLPEEQLTVTLPALGCGHGGLEWSKVKKLIEKYLINLNHRILVFEPSSSMLTDSQEVDEKILEENNIKRIRPNDYNFPAKLKGKSAANLYVKGDYNSVISEKLLTIFVNSKADERERKAIFSCLDAMPRDRFRLLLGFNSSFEKDIVKHSLQNRFKIIVFLPHGHLCLKIRKDLEEFWNDSIVLLTQSNPEVKWNIKDSINSLKLRLKLPDATLISSQNLDSIKKFESDIKDSDSKIFYINYWENSQDIYERITAKSIGRKKESLNPNVTPLVNAIVSD